MAAADLRPLVPVLVGPTAVGKTAVAAALAASTPVAVISADARQVYRGLDVGTAKPDRALRARVPHYGLDLLDPGERYSAGRFARDAVRWLDEIRAGSRLPVVVGGTGFYVRALADGLFREPALAAQARERLRQWAGARDGASLARWAARLDPGFGGGGRQRAARAIEVALLTGRSLSWWQREARDTGVMRPWYILLTAPRKVLRQRIADRVTRMLADGLEAEVDAALATGVPPDAAGLDGVGYREVIAVRQGRLERARLRDAIVVATRQYAKRQETWFRNQLRGKGTGDAGMVWTVDATEQAELIAGHIWDRWQAIHRSPVPSPQSPMT